MATVKFEVANTRGKEWRIEARFYDGRSFTIQPQGEISIDEAKSLCEAIVFALKAAGSDPLMDATASIIRFNQSKPLGL